MKIRLVILSLSCFMMMRCGEEAQTDTPSVAVETKEADEKISAKTIEAIVFTDYALSEEGEKAIVEWEKYHELATQINYLKKADFSFFNGEKNVLKTFMVEYHTQMPDRFRINPIISRNAVVETALLNLNANLTLDNIKRSDKIESIKALFEAFSNLNYQINKELERDFYNQIQPE